MNDSNYKIQSAKTTQKSPSRIQSEIPNISTKPNDSTFHLVANTQTAERLTCSVPAYILLDHIDCEILSNYIELELGQFAFLHNYPKDLILNFFKYLFTGEMKVQESQIFSFISFCKELGNTRLIGQSFQFIVAKMLRLNPLEDLVSEMLRVQHLSFTSNSNELEIQIDQMMFTMFYIHVLEAYYSDVRGFLGLIERKAFDCGSDFPEDFKVSLVEFFLMLFEKAGVQGKPRLELIHKALSYKCFSYMKPERKLNTVKNWVKSYAQDYEADSLVDKIRKLASARHKVVPIRGGLRFSRLKLEIKRLLWNSKVSAKDFASNESQLDQLPCEMISQDNSQSKETTMLANKLKELETELQATREKANRTQIENFALLKKHNKAVSELTTVKRQMEHMTSESSMSREEPRLKAMTQETKKLESLIQRLQSDKKQLETRLEELSKNPTAKNFPQGYDPRDPKLLKSTDINEVSYDSTKNDSSPLTKPRTKRDEKELKAMIGSMRNEFNVEIQQKEYLLEELGFKIRQKEEIMETKLNEKERLKAYYQLILKGLEDDRLVLLREKEGKIKELGDLRCVVEATKARHSEEVASVRNSIKEVREKGELEADMIGRQKARLEAAYIRLNSRMQVNAEGLRTLEREVSLRDQDIQKYSEQLDTMRGSTKAESSLLVLKSELREKEKELRDFRSEIDSLKKKLNISYEYTESKAIYHTQAKNTLEKELKQTVEEYNSLKKEIKSIIQARESDNESSKRETSLLETKLAQKGEEIEHLRAKGLELETKLRAKESELVKLSREIQMHSEGFNSNSSYTERLESNIKLRETELEDIRNERLLERSRLESEIKDLNNRIKRLESSLDQKDLEIHGLRSKLQSQEDLNKAKEKEIEDLANDLKSLDLRYSTILKLKENLASKLKEEIDNKSKEIDRLKDLIIQSEHRHLKEIDSKDQSHKKELDSLISKSKNLSDKYHLKQEELKAMRAKMAALEDDLVSTKADSSHLTTRIEKNTKEFEISLRTKAKLSEALEEELTACKKELKLYEIRFDSLSREHSDAVRLNESSQESLRSELHSKHKEIRAMTIKLKDLEYRYSILASSDLEKEDVIKRLEKELDTSSIVNKSNSKLCKAEQGEIQNRESQKPTQSLLESEIESLSLKNRTELADKDRQIKKLESLLASKSRDYQNLCEEIANMTSSLENSIKAMRDKNNEIQNDSSAVKREITKLSDELTALNQANSKELQDLNFECFRSHRESKLFKVNAEEFDNEIQKIEEGFDKENSLFDTKAETHRESIRLKEVKIQLLRNELEHLDLTSLKSKIHQEEIDSIKSILKENCESLLELKSNIDDLTSKLNKGQLDPRPDDRKTLESNRSSSQFNLIDKEENPESPRVNQQSGNSPQAYNITNSNVNNINELSINKKLDSESVNESRGSMVNLNSQINDLRQDLNFKESHPLKKQKTQLETQRSQNIQQSRLLESSKSHRLEDSQSQDFQNFSLLGNAKKDSTKSKELTFKSLGSSEEKETSLNEPRSDAFSKLSKSNLLKKSSLKDKQRYPSPSDQTTELNQSERNSMIESHTDESTRAKPKPGLLERSKEKPDRQSDLNSLISNFLSKRTEHKLNSNRGDQSMNDSSRTDQEPPSQSNPLKSRLLSTLRQKTQAVAFLTDSKIKSQKLLGQLAEQVSRRFSTRRLLSRKAFSSESLGDSARGFHEACDGLKNSLSVVQTDQGFLVGGFTFVSWKGSYSKRVDPKAFLFVFSEGDLYLYERDICVFSFKDHGPSFGGESHIKLYDRFFTAESSCTIKAVYNGNELNFDLKFKVRNLEVFEISE